MGVYIKGMEMPKCCNNCDFNVICNYANGGAHRPKGCPLVEVKTPHGRLVDADALAMKWIFGQPEKREIQEAPTIIKAEG